MREGFEDWMVEVEGKVLGTVFSYAEAINIISQHYSRETGRHIDIYQINDIAALRNICAQYGQAGRYADFGYEDHGRYRAAIRAYVRYYEETGGGQVETQTEEYKTITEGKIIVKKNLIGDIIINIRLPGILKET